MQYNAYILYNAELRRWHTAKLKTINLLMVATIATDIVFFTGSSDR